MQCRERRLIDLLDGIIDSGSIASGRATLSRQLLMQAVVSAHGRGGVLNAAIEHLEAARIGDIQFVVADDYLRRAVRLAYAIRV